MLKPMRTEQEVRARVLQLESDVRASADEIGKTWSAKPGIMMGIVGSVGEIATNGVLRAQLRVLRWVLGESEAF